MVESPRAIAGTWVQSLVQEGPTCQGVRGSTLTGTAHPGRAPQEPFARVVLRQEVLVRTRELTSLHQLEECRQGQETPRVQPPPRILLAGIHLG